MTTNSKPLIIGFSGKFESGKDFSTKIAREIICVQREGGVVSETMMDLATDSKVMYLTDSLKTIAAVLTGEDYQYQAVNPFYSNEFKDSKAKAPYDHFYNREIITTISDALTTMFDKDCVVNALMARIDKLSIEEATVVFVPDVRYESQVKAIQERGGIVVRLERPLKDRHGYEALEDVKKEDSSLYSRLMHSSETALDNQQFDYYLRWENDASELHKKVHELLVSLDIIE
jgi:hypothetical protein